jgi:serine/threonine protein kinase
VSPRYCLNCSQLLPVDSDSDRCVVCLRSTDKELQSERPEPVTIAEAKSAVPNDPAAISETATHVPVHLNTTISVKPVDPLAAVATTLSAGQLPSASDEDFILQIDRQAGLPIPPPGFELIRRLGSGAMGDVYLAFERVPERQVALKLLRASRNPAAIERFMVEVSALARIDHPNIVRVLATDFLYSVPFFTMEFVAGGTLSGLVAERGPLAVNEAAQLMTVVARAIDAAHSASVLHRDLKPGNILLGADGTPKVADFGLAKRMDQDDGLTLGSGPLGTAGFMPPEQVSRRHGTVGPTSDVYGLGATLYCLLTGHPPFTGENSHEIVARVISEPPERLRAIRAEIPAGLEAIVLKCLEKKQKDRYPTAGELAEDLDRFLAGESQLAPQFTHRRRLWRWAKLNRVRLAGLGIAVIVFVGIIYAGRSAFPRDSPSSVVESQLKNPADPVAETRKELASGHPVTLIGPTGLPKYGRPILEPIALGLSPLGDGTCSFHAFRYALLELFPNPGIDHYRVDLEIRRIGSNEERKEEKPASGKENDWLGFYFGYGSGLTSNIEIGHLMYAVTFKDYPPLTPQGQTKASAEVWLRSIAFVQNSNTALDPLSNKIDAIPFKHSKPYEPGLWRSMSVEVSPEGFLILWQGDEPDMDGMKKMVTFGQLDRDQVDLKYAKWKSKMVENGGSSNNLPNWSPDMPFGLIVFKSSVSIRNVVVTPLR